MVSVLRRFFTLLLVLALCAGGFPAPALAKNVRGVKETAPKPARALVATASVAVNGLGDVLIGENFSFTVSFKNTGGTPGYGPFVDLVFPTNGADGNFNQSAQDGVDFISAAMAGYTFSVAQDTLVTQKFPDPAGGATCVDHPWARQTNGELVKVCGPSGDTLVSLRLPFGSVVPGQAVPNITVNAKLSSLADVGTDLNIRSRGGFLYGNDPLDNWCCGDTPIISNPSTNSGTWPGSPLTPKVFTFDKTYSGPDNVEDETATGPNFIRQYTLTVDIAAGQTLTDIDVVDELPDNEQYVSLAGTTTGGYSVTSAPSITAPGGLLTLNYGSATGTASTSDVQVVFNFYIPRLDANAAAVINPSSGNDALAENPAWTTSSWVPGDGRDSAQSLASDSICIPGGVCTPLHTLEAKAIAIQKSVTNLTDSNNSAGDIFQYSLTFQVSDYFAFDTVSLTDVISDGQRVNDNFVPTMQFSGNGYNLATAPISAANHDISCNYTGGPGGECSINNPAGNDGTTSLVVRISNEIVTRGQNGRLIGGCVNPAGGNLPVCSTGNPGNGPTTGTITFQTILQEDFANAYPSGDPSVDQGDEFTDEATIKGRVLDNNTFAAQQLEDDDATAAFTIARNGLSKAIYAINGDTNSSNWQYVGGEVAVKPSDEVTYRISYNLNTSDVEDLVIEDYLPLPVFFVNDPDADGTNGPAFTFTDAVSAAVPAVGEAKFGPSDTFRAYSGIVPTLTRDGAKNILRFTYGDYDKPQQDDATVADLLFTVRVSTQPFADKSFIANQAHQTEGSTNTGAFSQDAFQWFILTQPALFTSKGVIWTSSPSAVIDPLPAGPVAFLPPSAAPRWSGTVNSSGLAARPINSDITGVRAGDTVSFGIVIENKGTSLAGAFDIVISDSLPEIYTMPAAGPNVQVYYGDGTGPIDIEVNGVVTQSECIGGWPGNPCGPDKTANTPDDLFGRGIKLVDPVGQGVCDAYNPNLGNNVILVTYDVQVKDKLKPGTYTNTGRIKNYAGGQGGRNHSQGTVTWGLRTQDTAKAAWISATRLAETGFAPGIVTKLPEQPVDSGYVSMPNLRLEIPTLDVNLPVIGIPNTANGWNLTWLSNQAGYLQGTTPPSVVGNTVLTGHVYLADGSPGPFVNLGKLRWGQTIILHADGYRYTYQVRENQTVSPTNMTVFREDGYAWLTLITCKDYSAVAKSYRYRVAVRAVLLKVERE